MKRLIYSFCLQMLHQLAARAVITDYENGVLDDDRIQHQVGNTFYFY